MDSPKRKQLKRNDYLRHKMFRKIRKQQKAELEQQKKAAEKELKRRLRVTPLPKFDDGAIPTLFKPEDDVTYTRTNVNSQLIGMNPSTGVWYDRTNGKRLGNSIAIDDVVVTPKNGNIDNFGNVYNTVGGVTTRTSPDGRKTIVAETPVSNADPVGLFFVEGAALSPLFRPVELVAGSPELVKLAKQNIEAAYRKKMGSFFGGLAAQMDSRLLNSSKIGIGDAEKNVLAGKVGWAPKQTFTGYHASDDPNMVPDYFKDTWSIKNHNAPHGFYIAGGRSPYRGFLTKRPYIYDVEALFDKPMVQLGESIGTTKNGVRNDIERYAQYSGADGIVFNGIADNQMQNQFIAKTLNPDVVLNANRRYDIDGSDFESFTIPTEDLQTSLNAPINNPVVINGKEYPTMKTLMNKVEMIKPNELNAAHLLAQKEIRMYLESPEYRLRLIDNGFDPDKYISALEHYLGSRVKYGDLNSRTKGVTEIVNGEPEITLNNSVFDTDYDTLIHELAHALTKNLDHSMYVKNFIDTRLKDIMLYNEKILPQLDRDVVARSGVSIDRLAYLNDPLEIRARMISIIMDARRKGIKLSEYIDKVKSNRLLNDLKSFLKVEDIKKYGANILGVTPFAMPLAKNNKQKDTK